MKSFRQSNSNVVSGVRTMRPNGSPSRLFARGALTTLLAVTLTGCVTVRTVNKTVLAPDVRKATLDDLLKKMAEEYAAVQTLTLTGVEITATSGGSRQGQVKEYPSFPGYILLRKPADLRVIMLVPIARRSALDMVSDGKDFKVVISEPKCKAIVGLEDVMKPTQTGLESLRPKIIRDALQIPPVSADEFVTLTENSRLIAPAHGHKEAIEEPDYDLSVLHHKPGEADPHVLAKERVIHISRVNLLPYEQDLYDDQGRIQTTISYSKFQKFGTIDYPMSIFIKRPLDEYTLRIDIGKLRLNEPMDDPLQFTLTIPTGCPVQQM
jgi:hypothetical protein